MTIDWVCSRAVLSNHSNEILVSTDFLPSIQIIILLLHLVPALLFTIKDLLRFTFVEISFVLVADVASCFIYLCVIGVE